MFLGDNQVDFVSTMMDRLREAIKNTDLYMKRVVKEDSIRVIYSERLTLWDDLDYNAAQVETYDMYRKKSTKQDDRDLAEKELYIAYGQWEERYHQLVSLLSKVRLEMAARGYMSHDAAVSFTSPFPLGSGDSWGARFDMYKHLDDNTPVDIKSERITVTIEDMADIVTAVSNSNYGMHRFLCEYVKQAEAAEKEGKPYTNTDMTKGIRAYIEAGYTW